jgi:tetratricopeptide (TPR) repeat protein
MKSWARDIALGLLLVTAAPATPSFAAQTAEQILLDKANYWRLKDRPDLAVEALQQLLSINPNQPDALYQYGMLDVQQNKIEDAQGYLARLRKAAPSSPRITDLEGAIRAGQVSPNELNEARRLAQTGQFSQAAQKYQQTFQGPPPATFGVEYYMTLAGTPQGFDEARRGLETLVQNSPNDSRAKLALAQVLSYHADTRARGIRMLEQLTGDPIVGAQAAQAWKQAIIWLGGGPEDRQFYAQFLAKYPQDAQVRQHAAEMEKPGAAGTPSASSVGYADFNRGNLGGAEREFEAQLHRNPNDADAVAGIGLIRLRQQRFGEAREMLGRAMRIAPARRGQWATAYESASYQITLQEAKSAQSAGNYAAAEAAYRRALAGQPSNADAMVGLYSALAAEGKTAEAAELYSRLAALDPRRVAGLNRARADMLRADGKALETRGDGAGAQARYQEAIGVDPTDAWARLDFARFLAHQGSVPQAFSVIDPAASGNSADSFQAAAIFYSEQNRLPEALAMLDRVPASARTQQLIALHEQLVVTTEIARAKQLARSGNRAAARNILLALNSRPPASAQKTMSVANALADIGDTQEALQLARPVAGADKAAALNYAGLLTRAGRDAEATAYVTQAESTGRISGGTRQELEHVKIDIASKRADALRTRGDIAGAYDQISALLTAYPNDSTLLMTAGRIYAAAGQNTVAMQFFDAGYRQEPNDLGVIRAAVGGAIVAGDLPRARAYLGQAMQLYPNNPRLYYLQAEVARSAGDNNTALSDLAIARSLDTQQAGTFEPLPSAPAAAPGAPNQQMLPPNPFRQSQAEGSRPPIMLASAAPTVSANDASDAVAPAPIATTASWPTPAPAPAAAPTPRRTLTLAAAAAEPAPLQDTAVSAGSDDLVVPPHVNDRPARRMPAVAANNGNPFRAQQVAAPYPTSDPGYQPPNQPAYQQQVAQLEPLPPPPIQGYQASGAYAQAGYAQPGYSTGYTQPAAYAQPASAPAPLEPLGPPPIQGYQAPFAGQPAPAPQDSLELDIQRSMAEINAQSGPTATGGLAFRYRDGEEGLSQLTEIGVPLEATFSPFYTGTMRLQAVPTYLTAGSISTNSLLRFGHEPLIALNPGAGLQNLVRADDQTAGGAALNVAYAYQMFSGEVGTTPLGFERSNIVGRLSLTWPGPSGVTTAYQPIPLPPNNPANPLQVKIEGARQPITDSLLSYAATKDPVTGAIWGAVVKSGGDVLVSYDDGLIGLYGGGGFWGIDGTNVASNSEIEGLVGGYVRPYRTPNSAFKIGVNLSYMGYDKNLSYFTFGQGGYFSPQTYLNFSVPMEYVAHSDRLTYLVGGALGVQTFNESSSPVFPVDAGDQNALTNAFGTASSFYPSRSVTGFAFNLKGQFEYQLDNGFTVGGLATIDNAQNYTEGVAKLYLRKAFGAVPPTASLPMRTLPGSL